MTRPNFGSGLAFPSLSIQSTLHGLDQPALAFAEGPDTIGLMCWLFRDQLLARINAGIDEAADDKAAMSQQQRDEAEAQINSDALLIERSECALIWEVEAQGEMIDFQQRYERRWQCLGLGSSTSRAPNPSGTSPMHPYRIVGGRR